MKASELLAAIPEEWRDIPRDDLLGCTPREATVHVEESNCRACFFALQGLGRERNR